MFEEAIESIEKYEKESYLSYNDATPGGIQFLLTFEKLCNFGKNKNTIISIKSSSCTLNVPKK